MGIYRNPSGFWRKFGLAGRGLFYTWKTQWNLRLHILIGTLAVACAWWLEISRLEWLVLILTIGCVLSAEVINTAVELAVDLTEPHFNPLAGLAKDVAAGAVLLTAIQAVIVGIVLFLSPLLRLF
jgi:diacylglycerol kinase